MDYFMNAKDDFMNATVEAIVKIGEWTGKFIVGAFKVFVALLVLTLLGSLVTGAGTLFLGILGIVSDAQLNVIMQCAARGFAASVFALIVLGLFGFIFCGSISG